MRETNTERKKASRIPCAIYTRKSTDEGLDQAFNSLDAQFEACEAYVASQKHEGWRLVSNRYDDGGISGGTLQRPGLEHLLHDIDRGLVKMIVVYKIDRLTRSLADFAKLVERMDETGCSFVSVTQSFNTSSSMGRLTLNVLLSFAQFEREVTAERIRDKISASKAKGMWMGGYPPLGYNRDPDPNKRSLIVNSHEAQQIKTLFDLFERHGRLVDVEREARKLGIRSKHHQFSNGNVRGGSFMSRGQIHALLSNPIHTGMIRHKQEVYEGLHEPIIKRDRWLRVQKQLIKNARKPRAIGLAALENPDTKSPELSMSVSPSTKPLLRGLLFDEHDRPLGPSFCCKGKKRYHYYVLVADGALKRGTKNQGNQIGLSIRLPARQIEGLVTNAIQDLFDHEDKVQRWFNDLDLNEHLRLKDRSAELVRLITQDPYLLRQLLFKINLGDDTLTIKFNPVQIARSFSIDVKRLCGNQLQFVVPFTKRRRGNETKLMTPSSNSALDNTLIKTLASSHRWLTMVKENISIEEIAQREKRSNTYIRTRLPFALLSPKIQTAILNGTQPMDLTADKLARMTIPMKWDEQERVLGFCA